MIIYDVMKAVLKTFLTIAIVLSERSRRHIAKDRWHISKDRRHFSKERAALLKGTGYILSKHVFVFFGQIWPLWTMKTTPNILPRCNKTFEQHSYIWWTVTLRMFSKVESWDEWKCFVFNPIFFCFEIPGQRSFPDRLWNKIPEEFTISWNWSSRKYIFLGN